ncbi:hypothetical protein [Shewanella sp.]|uniref:hypothetical protein n=1 Tax=Shewanella sp. TaxID=50422 RepID=UPI003A97DB7C
MGKRASKLTALATAVTLGLAGAALSTSAIAKQDDHHEHKQAKHKQEKPLPPGLQKKLANGEPLPPGWAKNYRRGDILDRRIFDRGRITVPIDRDGIITVNVDNQLIRLFRDTREIIDILK